MSDCGSRDLTMHKFYASDSRLALVSFMNMLCVW